MRAAWLRRWQQSGSNGLPHGYRRANLRLQTYWGVASSVIKKTGETSQSTGSNFQCADRPQRRNNPTAQPLPKMISRLLLFVPACVSLAMAQESTPTKSEPPLSNDVAEASAIPTVTKLDENRFKIGGIILDRKTREIRFPAKVNMVQGHFEYLMVYHTGYVHESFLVTDISPSLINLVFNSLSYPPSQELFCELDETGHPTGILIDVPMRTRAFARVSVEVEWNENGITQRSTVNDWFQNPETKASLSPGSWLFTGIAIVDKSMPQLSPNAFSAELHRESMLNYACNNDQGEIRWQASSKHFPPVGTEMTVIISPFFKPKSAPTPKSE
jgi:hypothetical protein